MTHFIVTPTISRQHQYGWLAALVGAFALHGLIVWIVLWQPESPHQAPVAAAPLVFDISMVAAPVAPVTDLPVDPLQQQSSPPPQQQTQSEPPPEAQQAPQMAIAISDQADVVVQQANDTSPPTTERQQSRREHKPQTPAATETPEETPEPQEVAENTTGEATGEQQVAQSSAPLAVETHEAEQASALAVGALSEQQSDAEMDWQSELQAHLERRKRYPREAQIRRQQGVPWVRFSMDRDGKVLDVQLYRGSGYAALDREAVALLHRAEPLPKPPPHISDAQLNMAVPVQFYIQ